MSLCVSPVSSQFAVKFLASVSRVAAFIRLVEDLSATERDKSRLRTGLVVEGNWRSLK